MINLKKSIEHIIKVFLIIQLQMDKAQIIEQQEEIQRYLQSHSVYQILQEMIEKIMIQKPSNPIDFMIRELGKPQRQIIFMIGPPGLRLYSHLEQAIRNYEKMAGSVKALNCGQYIQKNLLNKLSEQSKEKFSNCRLIPNEEIIGLLLPAIKQLTKQNANIIIEGFPKTLEQAQALQRENIFPNKVIFINSNEESLRNICDECVNEKYPDLQVDQKKKASNNIYMEYMINTKALKNFFKVNHLQIDALKYRSDRALTQEMERLLGLRFDISKPKNNHRIVLMGSPLSGRTTLGKGLAKKYKIVYVSTATLIAQQIRKDSITGRKIKEQYLSQQIIDSFVLEKLIQDRISQKDCQMQGFVLQGYPKTIEQWENLKNLKIYPTFYIGINAKKQQVEKRASQNVQALSKRFGKWNDLLPQLEQNGQKIFWVDTTLNESNMLEDTCFQIEKRT